MSSLCVSVPTKVSDQRPGWVRSEGEGDPRVLSTDAQSCCFPSDSRAPQARPSGLRSGGTQREHSHPPGTPSHSPPHHPRDSGKSGEWSRMRSCRAERPASPRPSATTLVQLHRGQLLAGQAQQARGTDPWGDTAWALSKVVGRPEVCALGCGWGGSKTPERKTTAVVPEEGRQGWCR